MTKFTFDGQVYEFRSDTKTKPISSQSVTEIKTYSEEIKKQILAEAEKAGLLHKQTIENKDKDLKNSLRKNEQEKDEKYIESAKKRLEDLEKIVDFGAHGMICYCPVDKYECTSDNLLYSIALSLTNDTQKSKHVLENTLSNIPFGRRGMIGYNPDNPINKYEYEYTSDNLLYSIALSLTRDVQKSKHVLETTLKNVPFGDHGMIGYSPINKYECTYNNLLYSIALSLTDDVQKSKHVLENTLSNIPFGPHGMIGYNPDIEYEYTSNNLLYSIALSLTRDVQKSKQTLKNTLKNVPFGADRMICSCPDDKHELTYNSLLLAIAEAFIGKAGEI